MFRFSLRDLMTGMALVSIGLGMALWSRDLQWLTGPSPCAIIFSMVYFAATASVGGGLLYPLGQGFLGANIGFLGGLMFTRAL
ncbi:MAG: hypothetical protein U0805_21735 [Pirellulales bacterium]